MLKLDRADVIAPACLAAYDYRTHSWDDFKGPCKKQLRFALFQLQGIPGISIESAAEYGLRCAYCECAIRNEGHIEHFRRKNPRLGYPELTFEWSNLFLACGASTHCGHYKDHRLALPYNPDQLIKPDEHNPEHYLYFHSSGEVRARSTLNEEDKIRATETIRVFGLNNKALEGSRAKAVNSYRKMKADDFEELASWDETEINEYLQGEIENTRWDPYATTIKHFLHSPV